jgi:glycolate oxidase FAD binding subunit
MDVFEPGDIAEAAGIIAASAAEGHGVEILAGGSKRGYGRAGRPARQLLISHIRGVIDYEPSELRLTARAATPMAEIEALVDGAGQMLSFEPMHWQAAFGEGRPTLGGVIACNLAGPRRVRAGAARDHLLGFSANKGRRQGGEKCHRLRYVQAAMRRLRHAVAADRNHGPGDAEAGSFVQPDLSRPGGC